MAKEKTESKTDSPAKTREKLIAEARENNKLTPLKLNNRFSAIQLQFHDFKSLNIKEADAKEYFSKPENVSQVKELVADVKEFLGIMALSNPKHQAVLVQSRNLKQAEEWLAKYAA